MASSSTYGKQPLYYGKTQKSPLYYGSSRSPVYYGGGGGAPYYYGGGMPYGGNNNNNQDNESLVGTITIGRVLRVISQRWISVLVFLLIGLVAAFAVYRISPTIYEAKSEFTMDTRRPSGGRHSVDNVGIDMGAFGNSYAEIFNTRLSDWRSDKIVTKIIQQYRANYPASTVTDRELIDTLGTSQLELVRNSRLITIAVRSTTAQLAAALANAYAEAIESFTDEENKLRCDKAVSQVHEQVEKQRRMDESVNKQLLEFRTKHKIDELESERDIIRQSLQKTTADVLQMRSEVTAAIEWQKVLKAAQEKPEEFGALPSNVPRSSEIGEAYTRLQNAKMEMNALLSRFTKNHPEVKSREKLLETIKQEFVDAVSRALSTANGNLAAFRNQLAEYEKQSDKLRADQASVGQKIISADAGLKQLEQEKVVSSTILTDLMQKENEARIAAEQNNEIVRVGRPALVPSRPVLPNPIMIFAIGAAISLAIGLLFVLILDHLEDTIVSLNDIEQRLSLKVLAVLPHIRRKKREQVAKFIYENKYSQFAEAVAGLRNLLDSPRYQPISQVLLVMSTQPGEGKTITSCSIAISSAQAGKKTLLVDFDLRRPRLARIWGIVDKLEKEHSFSHFLSGKDTGGNFKSVVKQSGIEHLDVCVSMQPDGVNPSSIMGSQIVPDFFKWARANYDRIIIDSPPFGIVGDVMTLAAMVDSVMIMCCPDRTHFKPIQHASRSLSEAGATVIGVIVNDVEIGGAGSAFSQGGYNSYGYGYRRYGSYSAYGPAYSPYAPERKAAKKVAKPGDAKSTELKTGNVNSAEPKAAESKPEGEAPTAPGPNAKNPVTDEQLRAEHVKRRTESEIADED